MKKLLVSASALALLTVGYNSATYAEQNPNDKDCKHFGSKQEVMEFWYNNGYSASNDPHDLDRDNDGLPCEVKKGDYDQFVASKQKDKEEAKKKAEETAKTEQEKEQAATKPEPVKQENKQEATKQQPAKQENKQTTTKQEQTKTEKQTATKETKKQGEKLPNTASNGVTMILTSLGLALVGSVLMFRRKKTN
ncbi:excalibur calcium-binding domain-containing protein [Bacillus cereus]|uniref:excalibur calcium-binding domain-containing protein n=1 Tax=Bacillus cereus TaxID=1396 RepID=UPI000BF8FD76|nr:excalibur calcium-binding domain-containing protein [Bacillus cereus]PEQ58219.1 cell wall anchor protein [Bacillus cereus]